MRPRQLPTIARIRSAAHRGAPWRRLLASRTVRRRVQGVDLYLPWSHRLPDYATVRPDYGQNLVELATKLAATVPDGRPIQIIDIGANIGDSALQIVNAVDARVLCVEGDPYWIGYLARNVGSDPRITVQEALLIPVDGAAASVQAVRSGGTTRFVPGTGVCSQVMTAGELRESHPEFDAVRLIKSDTDGFDAVLVPAVAAAFSGHTPVLFFEFDPHITREVTGDDANRVWAELASLGYTRVAVWSNLGDPLGQLDIESATSATFLAPDDPRKQRDYDYWDVAVRYRDDLPAAVAFDALNPGPLAEPAARRRG